MRTILCKQRLGLLGSLSLGGLGLALPLFGLQGSCTEVVVGESTGKPDAGRDAGVDMRDGAVIPTPIGWRWESPRPQGNNLRALWGIPGTTAAGDELYAAGESGTVVVGGSTDWQIQRSSSFDARTILGISGQGTGSAAVVVAVGLYDLALRRQNNIWNDLNPILGAGDGNLNAIWSTPTPGEHFVVGTTGRIYYVRSNGSSFTREGMGVTPDTLFAVSGVATSGTGTATEVYAVGSNGRIVHRQSGTWTVEADTLVAQTLNAVWCGDGVTSGQVFAAGDSGVFLVRKGGTWTPETTPVTTQLTSLWGVGDEQYAVGSAGTVLQRRGGTWKQEAMGLTSELLSAVWGSNRGGQTTVYAVGNSGTILRRTAGTWESLSTRVTGNTLSSVWARSPQEIYAVGSDGLVLRRSGAADSGTWAQVAQGMVTAPLNYVTGYAPSAGVEADVYAVGGDGTILHKSQAGTWAVEGVLLTSQELTGVWAGADSVWVVGRNGRVGKKLAGGSWMLESGPGGMPITEDLFAVYGFGQGTGQVSYVAGANGLLLRRSGAGWTKEATGLTTQSLVALFGSGEDNLYALGNKGAVLRRSGGTWVSAPIRQFTGGAAGVGGSLNPQNSEIWIAGTRGTILRQAGTDWQSEVSLTVQPFSSIAVAGSNDVYIVGPSGLILHKF